MTYQNPKTWQVGDRLNPTNMNTFIRDQQAGLKTIIDALKIPTFDTQFLNLNSVSFSYRSSFSNVSGDWTHIAGAGVSPSPQFASVVITADTLMLLGWFMNVTMNGRTSLALNVRFTTGLYFDGSSGKNHEMARMPGGNSQQTVRYDLLSGVYPFMGVTPGTYNIIPVMQAWGSGGSSGTVLDTSYFWMLKIN